MAFRKEQEIQAADNAKTAAELAKTHNTVPLSAAEQHDTKRDRTSEVPLNRVEELEVADANKEPVTLVEVKNRGSIKKINPETGDVVSKELDVPALLADNVVDEEDVPDYIKLHQEVLDGADPYEATAAHAGVEKDAPEDTTNNG